MTDKLLLTSKSSLILTLGPRTGCGSSSPGWKDHFRVKDMIWL